jgi:hypothetical protein
MVKAELLELQVLVELPISGGKDGDTHFHSNGHRRCHYYHLRWDDTTRSRGEEPNGAPTSSVSEPMTNWGLPSVRMHAKACYGERA